MNLSAPEMIELNARLDKVLEFRGYDEEDGDNRLVKNIAGVGAVGGGGLLGGLYLRNRGDAVNAERWKAMQAAQKGATGAAIPELGKAAEATKLTEQAVAGGGNWRAIKTGAGDVLKGAGGKLKDFFSKFKWTRAIPIKASAKIESLVELEAKIDETLKFDVGDAIAGAGIVGGTGLGLYRLHQHGARVPLNAREKKMYGKLGSRVAGSNIRVGASELLKSLAKKIR